MKIISQLIFIFGVLSTCYGQDLKVTIYNKTGYDLDSVSLGECYVGIIKKESSVLVSDCKGFTVQDGVPFGFAQGTIKEKKKNTERLGLCGTGVSFTSSGVYKFDIAMMEQTAGYRLFWTGHR